MDDPLEPPSSTAFTVLKQKLHLDFSFSPRRVEGKTTIDIQPVDEHLRYIQLNCRQVNITSVKVEGHDATQSTYYSDLYRRLSLYPGTNIHQHHWMKKRMQRHAAGKELELEITVPDAVKIRRMNPEDATADQLAATGYGVDGENLYTPIKVEIEYSLENPRDALQYVGVEDGDARYPHVYTANSPFPGTASCLFPCVDDGVTKCIFDVSVRYPRTLGDVFTKARHDADANGTVEMDGSPKADSVMSDVDDDLAEFDDEEKALEMAVICSGELTDDISDPTDPTRKTASFTCAVPVLPQHIGVAVGPFRHVDLSSYRDTQDDERLGSNAIRVHAFCLPKREDEVRNSAMILARTLDSFTQKYQSYPFEKAYKLAFVDNLEQDVAHSASFSICSSRLLFPETIWEPLDSTTRTLVHAVASQWIGINVTAQRPQDQWVIAGGSWFMAELHLQSLFGRNDHRFRQKMMADKILQLDVRRPSLYVLGEYLAVDPGEAEFMALKAPMVLAILHHRLVKQSGKNGVDRCLYRLLFNARNEKLPNSMVSTEAFLDICEKVGHQKLDTFFNQWIYGSGCPTFECHPVFNKKKQVIQLTIKQTQGDPTLKPEERFLGADEVIREAKEKANGFRPSSEYPAFVGPMTIRIHEADGTPYEHIVDINSSTVKVEIPYNTKYKRLKKSRRDKERAAAAAGLDPTGEGQEDAVIYMLGDVLESPEEMQEWKISEWSQEEENRMDQEFYEWIRVDADFEWICQANINDMPAYMYVSQLQQDKDVIAQAQSIQWLALKEGHPLMSSILLKTLMDNRYFHGIRTMAAGLIAISAKEELHWIGFFHLQKAFQELFCIKDSPMTRSNDFSDRASYIIQCAIPRAIARIKGADGKAPMMVKNFLLDLMRYNDNRGNEYSDDHYISTLMLCLAQSLMTTKKNGGPTDPTLSLEEENVEFDFQRKALEELQRHQRLDEWIPSYQNIYTMTALECALMLMKNKVLPLQATEFLQYVRVGNADNVRLKAWECLIDCGMIRKDAIVKYLIHDITSDPSPYVRARLIRIFDTALGQIATGDEFKLEKASGLSSGALVIEQEDGLPNREAELARRKLDGALRALKSELVNNECFKLSLEKALCSTTTSAHDLAELLEVSQMIYTPVNKLVVTCKLPKYWKVQHLGNGRLRFYHSNRYRSRLPPPPVAAVVAPPPALPPLPLPLPLSIPQVAAPQEARPKVPLKIKLNVPKAPAPEQRVEQRPEQRSEQKPQMMAPEPKRPNVLPPKPPTPVEQPSQKLSFTTTPVEQSKKKLTIGMPSSRPASTNASPVEPPKKKLTISMPASRPASTNASPAPSPRPISSPYMLPNAPTPPSRAPTPQGAPPVRAPGPSNPPSRAPTPQGAAPTRGPAPSNPSSRAPTPQGAAPTRGPAPSNPPSRAPTPQGAPPVRAPTPQGPAPVRAPATIPTPNRTPVPPPTVARTPIPTPISRTPIPTPTQSRAPTPALSSSRPGTPITVPEPHKPKAPKIRVGKVSSQGVSRPAVPKTAARPTKPSKIVVLKISPEKLAKVPHGQRLGGNLKRKAERAPDGATPRALKRQASAEPLMNGYLEKQERKKKRKMVRLKIGRKNAQRVKDKGWF